MRVYYFGCRDVAGHYLVDHLYRNLSYSNNDLPWKQIDGVLCPEDTRKEGIVKINHKDGWTAFAFWDYSVDGRHRSNSVFFYEDLLDFDEAIKEFKETFPKIYKRFDFELVEWIIPEERTA